MQLSDEELEPEIETDIVLDTHIAGHPGLISKRERVLKPVQPTRNEEKVYQRIENGEFPLLTPYVPRYYGLKTKGEHTYLVLQNLLHSCKKPAFMDLKIGKSLHFREDPLRQGVYNLFGVFIHGVESSFLRLRNRVNEYVGRQIPIDDFDANVRLFFRQMGPRTEIVDRLKEIIRAVKSLDGVRFYGTSLFIVFDEEDSSFMPSLHLIDFERVRLDAKTDGSGNATRSQEEMNKLFRVKTVKKVVAETDKIQGSGGGPTNAGIRNDTDQQLVDAALLQDSGVDLYVLRSLRHLLVLVQEEWSVPAPLRVFHTGAHTNSLSNSAEHRHSFDLERENKVQRKPLPPRPIITYLVRHGERYDYTDVAWGRKAAFPHDSHLSPVGETQAEDIADRLCHVRPAMLVASPFQRAILSAVPLARRLRIPICVEPGLAEFLCRDTRTRVPGFFSSAVSISPWVDQNYKPFWPKLSLESWDQMRLRVAQTTCHLINRCIELGGDLIICSHRSTLTAAFEWLDFSQHPNARLEYGGIAMMAHSDWERSLDSVNAVTEHTNNNNDDEDDLTDEAKNAAAAEAHRGKWFPIAFNEVHHLRNHIQSPSSNPFRHIEGYYEDLSWTNYKKPKPVEPVTTATDPQASEAKTN